MTPVFHGTPGVPARGFATDCSVRCTSSNAEDADQCCPALHGGDGARLTSPGYPPAIQPRHLAGGDHFLGRRREADGLVDPAAAHGLVDIDQIVVGVCLSLHGREFGVEELHR